MADYNIQYYMEFNDPQLNAWRAEFLLKNGAAVSAPRLLTGTGTPLRFDRKNNNENKFEPIIKTLVTIQYMVVDEALDPSPETFIAIDNDEWQIIVYKNGNLYWRGFINPDNNTYPWMPTPYAFSILASDFSFAEAQPINLNDGSGFFMYTYITIGEAFKRALFDNIGYDNPVLNIVYSNKPDIIGVNKITDSLYFHTDAFYEFDKGPLSGFDALKRIVSSLGSRLEYSNGAYWLQYISDIGSSSTSILQITPNDLSGQEITLFSPFVFMGNTVADAVIYNANQEIMVNRSLKSKTFHYKFKAINQLVNFDWRNYTPPSTLPGWNVTSTMNISRLGAGSVGDQYRIRVFDRSPGAIIPSINQAITVIPGQRLQVQLKLIGNYAKDIGIGIRLGDNSASPSYSMDASGKWVITNDDGISNLLFPINIPNTNKANVDITSAPIPPDAQNNNAYLFISYPRVVDTGLPVGQTLYVDVYPPFLNKFNDLYVQFDETVSNEAKFSYTAEDEDLFFLDKADGNLSNSIFWSDGGIKKPLPINNWNGQTIDEIVTKQQAIQQSERTINVLGTFSGANSSFEQAVLLRDKSNLPTIFIRESHDVRRGTKNIMVSQQLTSTEQNITRVILPITKENQ